MDTQLGGMVIPKSVTESILETWRLIWEQESELLEMSTKNDSLLTLVNYEWIFVKNAELFKKKLQGE